MLSIIRECIFIGLSFLIGSLLSHNFAFSQSKKSIEYIPKVQHYSVNISQYESKGIGAGLKFLNHQKDIMQQVYSPQNPKHWKYRITDVAVFEENAKYLRFRIIDNKGKHLRHEYLQFRDKISAKLFIQFLLKNQAIHFVYDVLFKNVIDQNNGLRYLDHPAVIIYNTSTKKQQKLYQFVDQLVAEHRRETGKYGLHIFQLINDFINKRGTFSSEYKKKKQETDRLVQKTAREKQEQITPKSLDDTTEAPNEIPIIQGR